MLFEDRAALGLPFATWRQAEAVPRSVEPTKQLPFSYALRRNIAVIPGSGLQGVSLYRMVAGRGGRQIRGPRQVHDLLVPVLRLTRWTVWGRGPGILLCG